MAAPAFTDWITAISTVVAAVAAVGAALYTKRSASEITTRSEAPRPTTLLHSSFCRATSDRDVSSSARNVHGRFPRISYTE
jgi:hypothetical protein